MVKKQDCTILLIVDEGSVAMLIADMVKRVPGFSGVSCSKVSQVKQMIGFVQAVLVDKDNVDFIEIKKLCAEQEKKLITMCKPDSKSSSLLIKPFSKSDLEKTLSEVMSTDFEKKAA